MTETEPTDDTVLESLWSHAEQHWEKDAAHRALLEQCSSPKQLSELARRYRLLIEDSTRAAVAKRQLGAIAMIAMAQLEVRTPEASSGNRRRWALVALFLIGSAVLYSFL